MDGDQSELSLDEGSGCGDGQLAMSPEVSEAEETPPSLRRKSKGSCQLSLRQLEIVESLENSISVEHKELEEGEFMVDQPMEQIGFGPISDGPGPNLPLVGVADLPNPPILPPASSPCPSQPDPSIPPLVKSIPSNRSISKAATAHRLGGFVGKLSLREAKRMARLKIARSHASSNSQLKNATGKLAAIAAKSGGMGSDATKPMRSHSSTASINSRRSTAIHLGETMGFHYGKPAANQTSPGEPSVVK